MWMCGTVNVPSIRKLAHQHQTDCEFLDGTIFRLITYVGAAQQKGEKKPRGPDGRRGLTSRGTLIGSARTS
jgi:hypothetical protein